LIKIILINKKYDMNIKDQCLSLFTKIITELLLKNNTHQITIKIDALAYYLQNAFHYAK